MYALREAYVIHDQLKVAAQKFNSLTHHRHAIKENLKVFNDLGIIRVDFQFESHDLLVAQRPHKAARRSHS